MNKPKMHLVLEGTVVDEQSTAAVAGIVVRAFTGRSTRPAARAVTNNVGVFTITIDLAAAQEILSAPSVRFDLALPGADGPFHKAGAVRLDRLAKEGIVLAIPEEAMDAAFAKPRLALLADNVPAEELEAGQSLSIVGSGLRPMTSHDVRVRIERATIATLTLTTNSYGAFAPTVVLPQLGLWSPVTGEALTLREAVKTFGGKNVTVEIVHRKKTVAKSRIAISSRLRRSVGFVSDPNGRVRNAIQVDRDPLLLTIANVPKSDRLRVFITARQADWNTGDALVPALARDGRPLVIETEADASTATLQLAQPERLLPGAYDLVVRPVRYGFEEDEEPFLLPRDIVIGRNITGLVVQENFWLAKAVLGGCVNAFPMSGAPVAGSPYFRYRDTFVAGEDVWAALDPGIVPPGQFGKKTALYVVQSKTQAQWGASNSLTQVPANQPVEVIVQSGCINANMALVWPAAGPKGDYDIVADFGNNDPNPNNFVKDGAFDTPADMIDGYFAPGFRIVDDPGTMAEFANVGSFEIDAALLATLSLSASMTVEDEPGAYFTGPVVPVMTTFPRLATVRFPADAPGATTPSQISSVRPDYPLAVVVHGNGHNYVNYGFLLDHLARNGFVAVSIHLASNKHGLARANAFFDHLTTIQTLFGSSLQNNVGVLGHSRGGEAVFKIARLNQSLGLGIGLNALIALGPTDQYGRETITGAAAVPLFVLYGAKDGDVAGWPPYAGYNVRQTGFSLYDRYDDEVKSMNFVYEATHNGFVTHNEIPVVLSVADQQKVLLAYTNAFFRMNQRNEPEWVGMFTGEWKPPSVGATPAEMYCQYRHTQRLTIDDFEGAHTATSWATSTINDAVAQINLPADPTETQLFPQDNQSPHDTGGLRLTWDTSGDEIEFEIPASNKDVTAFTTLSIRLSQVVNSASNPAGPQNLRVGLRDGSNKERYIRVSAFGSIPQPADANVAGNKKSALTTIRIPLSAYTIVCAGAVQVDLDDITHVRLRFSEKPAGEIAVDELEFTN